MDNGKPKKRWRLTVAEEANLAVFLQRYAGWRLVEFRLPDCALCSASAAYYFRRPNATEFYCKGHARHLNAFPIVGWRGPPLVASPGQTYYYLEGEKLIPHLACTCRGFFDPRCPLQTHRLEAEIEEYRPALGFFEGMRKERATWAREIRLWRAAMEA